MNEDEELRIIRRVVDGEVGAFGTPLFTISDRLLPMIALVGKVVYVK